MHVTETALIVVGLVLVLFDQWVFGLILIILALAYGGLTLGA